MNRAALAAKRLVTESGIDSIPISLERLVDYVGAKLAYEPFDGDLSGMLYRDGSNIVIGINSTHSAARQRFTLAHELGHLRLHESRPMFVDKTMRLNFRNTSSSLGTNREEIEANAFAAELLMPQVPLQQEYDRIAGKRPEVARERLLQELAKAFQVSPQALEYRLVNLGYLSPA